MKKNELPAVQARMALLRGLPLPGWAMRRTC